MGARRDMNKSRLTRYAESTKAAARSQRNASPTFGGEEDTNLHSIGVDPSHRAVKRAARRNMSNPNGQMNSSGSSMGSKAHATAPLAYSQANQKISEELVEKHAQQKGTTREIIIYGVIAVLCLLSGRLDPSAIVQRVGCIIVVAFVMRAYNMVQF